MGYESFYEGSNQSLQPGSDSFYTGTKLPGSSLGGTTSVQTSNQLNEVNNLLNSCMRVMEVSTISPDVFEMIPKQHLKEISRLTKLTGSEATFHAPILDPSGFTEQGWTEQNRELVERQFTDIIKKAHDISPDKNMPVTIHSSSIPGMEMMPAKYIQNMMTPE